MTISLDRLKIVLPDFLEYMTGVRAATDSTVAAYKHDIDTYLEFLQSKADIVPGEFVINERTMRGFAIFLRARGNVDSTVQRRLDGISAFWKFLHDQYDFEEPKSAKGCGIRLKNKRNPSVNIPRAEYKTFMEAIYDDLRKIK
ncbi:MAG: site-specific integrase [Anaerolineales bacterium]|jgi:site-specific recombinase XerD|nr:site-specific integrase [Anaerolineales bacterium]